MDKLPYGTYLKVVRFTGGREAQVVLYLLQSGIFVFIGSSRGFELTIAGGKWAQVRDRLLLQGAAQVVFMDCPPYKTEVQPYAREFEIRTEAHTPKLEATDQSEAWSLLSWAPLTYVGGNQFIAVRAPGTPESWEEITGIAEPFILAASKWSKLPARPGLP